MNRTVSDPKGTYLCLLIDLGVRIDSMTRSGIKNVRRIETEMVSLSKSPIFFDIRVSKWTNLSLVLLIKVLLIKEKAFNLT